jgi:hypothetical protein
VGAQGKNRYVGVSHSGFTMKYFKLIGKVPELIDLL